MTHNDIIQLVRELLDQAGISHDDIEKKEDARMDTVVFNIRTGEARHLIGRNGDVIRAFNHIVQKIVEKRLENSQETPKFTLDVDDYFAKRLEILKNKARVMADRARSFKSSVELDPMSSYERLVIHQYLSESSDITTESIGQGPDRRIVVTYKMEA